MIANGPFARETPAKTAETGRSARALRVARGRGLCGQTGAECRPDSREAPGCGWGAGWTLRTLTAVFALAMAAYDGFATRGGVLRRRMAVCDGFATRRLSQNRHKPPREGAKLPRMSQIRCKPSPPATARHHPPPAAIHPFPRGASCGSPLAPMPTAAHSPASVSIFFPNMALGRQVRFNGLST